MNEEEIEEIKAIDRVRRRFPNTMPTFLEGGHYYRSWMETEDGLYFKIPLYPMRRQRPGERIAY